MGTSLASWLAWRLARRLARPRSWRLAWRPRRGMAWRKPWREGRRPFGARRPTQMIRLAFVILALAVLTAPSARAQSVADEARAGIAAAKEGEYDAAIQHFNQAMAVPGITDTERGRLFLYRGFADQELGLYDAAIGDFTQAIALGPAPGQAYYRRG